MLPAPFPALRRVPFALWLTLLLLCAVAHTAWSTSLDGFTIDEPYHIAAGATYLRQGDFRINPEHPPLVKLVAALAEPASVLHIPPFVPLDDKYQERAYTQTAVYTDSDYHAVQRRSRIALIALNTALLLALTLALRRVFSPAIALAVLLLLALDPTISAHMPVVMTDLPLALLGTVCCALAVLALRCRRWRDWMLFGLGAGLLLGTKHSAPLILLPLLALCTGVLLWQGLTNRRANGLQQGGRLAAAILLSVAVLWSLYGFRFYESRERDSSGHHVETFNRSLEAKITDLHSPVFQHTLRTAGRLHLLPRAYLWGLADTLRAGIEGRPTPVRAFGRDALDRAPWWMASADLLVKVPLPFFALAAGGVLLLVLQRFPPPVARPMVLFLSMLGFFMAFISKNGVFYAGLRHWLFAVPLLAIPAGACVAFCMEDRRRWLRWAPVAALVLIAVPTVPQRRIWEYHNVLAGGSFNAWRTFLNESVDLGQRSDELIRFHKAHVAPAEPMLMCMLLREQALREGIHPWEPAPEQVADGYVQGWIYADLPWLPFDNWKHIEVFRTLTPDARIGNVAIYHGRFYLPYMAGGILIGQAMRLLQEKNGDVAKAEQYLKRGVQLNPEASGAFIELGNLALARKEKEAALQNYRAAITAETESEEIRRAIRAHIRLVESRPVGDAPPMRRPSKE